MAAVFTDNDVSSFLKLIIEMGGGRTVDDTPDKYIRYASDQRQIMMPQEGKNVPLAIFGSRAADAIIINPFAEGDSESDKQNWFYSTTKVIVVCTLINIMRKSLLVGAEAHKKSKKDKEEDTPINLTAIRLLGKHAGSIDEKMVKEFDTISKDTTDFFEIYYNGSTKTTEVKSNLFIEARRKAFPSIRVETWNVLRDVLMNVLNTEDLGVFSFKSKLVGCPMFEGFVVVLLEVYDHLQHCEPISGRTENIINARGHLKYIGEYYSRSKWCTSATTSPTAQQALPAAGAPWNMGVSPFGQSVFGMPLQGAVPQGFPMMGQPVMGAFGQPMGMGLMGAQMQPAMAVQTTMFPVGMMGQPSPFGVAPQVETSSPNRKNPFAQA